VAPVELVDGVHQGGVPLLDQVVERDVIGTVGVDLRDHEVEIALDELAVHLAQLVAARREGAGRSELGRRLALPRELEPPRRGDLLLARHLGKAVELAQITP
jgi:hypothetical protein